MTAKLNLSLPADVGACSIARQAVRSFEPFLEPQRAPDLTLLVSEVITNGVRHTQSSAADSVVVELLLEEQVLRASVRDNGHGFEPPPAPEPGRAAPGGWGLFLVGELADRWGIESEDGTEVWFEFDRSGAPAAPGERAA